ncbi:MAG: alginate export family protein [Akkermansiaceae bacterium]
MMKKTIPHVLSACILTQLAQAGEPTTPAPTTPSISAPLFKFKGDLRGRYEFYETDPLDASHALTVRARLGLLFGDSSDGFSGYIEGEGTQALVDDFNTPGGSTPKTPGNSGIGDPDNAELNQAYLQYTSDGLLARIGRQRIIRNSAAFIGNVGWRQNEQTFDAAQLAYKGDGFNVSYAYFDRVQRIFGKDAGGALTAFEGTGHIFDFDYKASFGTVGGYAYLLDIDNNPNVGESNTVGLFTNTNGIYAELAFQDGSSSLAGGDYDALYGHLKYTTKLSGSTVMAGVEYLGENFKTPLATVHAYNGFADAFIGQRIGLNDKGGNYDGITDFYLGYVRGGLPGGLTFKGFLHYFMDGELSDSYGYEADAVLVKKFNDNLTGLFKASYFVGDDFYDDIKQVSFQLDYKF